MTNARLMGGADWKAMTWPEYQTMLIGWNAHHAVEGGAIAPDLDKVRKAMAGAIH